MNHGEDVSLFIGCLPGSDRRQVVLFPDGLVLADIREQEIELPTGDWLSDRGVAAARALIVALTSYGWAIDDMDHPASAWLKPHCDNTKPNIRIRAVTLTAESGHLEPGGQP